MIDSAVHVNAELFQYFTRWKSWFFFFHFTFYNCIVPFGFLQWKTQVAFPWESQLQQSHTIQPMVHAGCFSVSIIHRTMTWTTRSLTCTRILMHEIAHRGCAGTTRESALKVDSGRKIPCLTGESNLFNFGVNSVPRKKQTYFLPHPPPHPHPNNPITKSFSSCSPASLIVFC